MKLNYSSNFKALFFGLASVLLFDACAPSQQSKAEIEAEATASGPFFTGPNSLIAEQEVQFDQLIDGKELKAEQLQSVKLKDITIDLRPSDSIDFSFFDDASLSIVGSEVEMLSLGTLNPIESDGKSIQMQSSEEAELKEYFKAGKFSLVLDLGLNEDLYLEELGATIDMKLTIKYKE